MRNINMKIIITLVLINVLAFVTSRSFSTIQSPTLFINSTSVLVGPNTPVYLLKTGPLGLEVEKKINVFRTIEYNPISANAMYVEVLVFIDYDWVESFGTEEEIVDHVLNLWNKVDDTYSNLKSTVIKINIAGIIIPQDSQVFDFFNKFYVGLKFPAIKYSEVMADMGRWLYKYQDILPRNSYDVFMILTTSPDIRYSFNTQIGGVSMPYGACRIEYSRQIMSRGGIIHDGPGLISYKNAAHELAHILGAEHDQDGLCADDYNAIMHEYSDAFTTTWSSCSEKIFLQAYRDNWFPCLANIPQI